MLTTGNSHVASNIPFVQLKSELYIQDCSVTFENNYISSLHYRHIMQVLITSSNSMVSLSVINLLQYNYQDISLRQGLLP